MAQTIKAHAEARGGSADRLRDQLGPGQSGRQLGDRRPPHQSQWESYLAASGQHFDAEDEALVDRLVPPGHPSTPGYTDPLYPALGRRGGRGSPVFR